MMDETQIKAMVLEEKEGRSLWHLGALLTFKALGSETGGQLWAVEGLADKNMGVPLHVHQAEDEFWFVLEGEFGFVIGDETKTGGPGTFIYIPHGVPHSFYILSETGRWIGGGTPAILDGFFFETGEPATSLTLPPPPTAPPDVEMLVASLKRYGTDTLGPPPGH
jgi:mannose-6-phosphate isomerase-like protein (cupin superfamily)